MAPKRPATFPACDGRQKKARKTLTLEQKLGWFNKFQKRHSFHNLKLVGEASSADARAAAEYPEELKKIIEDGNYSSKQVFNIDETGLYWKKLPNRTYISKEEASAPGFKASKDRLTLLLGANAEGDYKLKPALVYHSENPRALKGYDKAFLPVYWYANSKGWMTGAVFGDYFKNKLHRELEVYCSKENIPFKILLIVDNAPSRPAYLADISNNIKIVFLPPNTTSLIQPCDQGIISTFKAYYLRSTLANLVKVTEQQNISVRDYWRQFTVKDALTFIKDSWNEVPTSCCNGVWKKLCPQFVHDFKGYSIDDNVAKANVKSLRLAQQVGFEDLEEEDIDNLLQSHTQELSNEDLFDIEKERVKMMEEKEEAAAAAASPRPQRALTAANLSECMDSLMHAMRVIEENDPNVERSSTIIRRVMENMACYNAMLKEKQQKTKQQPITNFFRQRTPSQLTSESETGTESEMDDPDDPAAPASPQTPHTHTHRVRYSAQ